MAASATAAAARPQRPRQDPKCFALAWPGHRAHCKRVQQDRKSTAAVFGRQKDVAERICDGLRAFIDRYGGNVVWAAMLAIGRNVSFDNLDSRVIQLDLEYDSDEPSIAKCMTMVGGSDHAVDTYLSNATELSGSVRRNIENAIDHVRAAVRRGNIAVIIAARCGMTCVIDPVEMAPEPGADTFAEVRAMIDRKRTRWQDVLLQVQRMQNGPKTRS